MSETISARAEDYLEAIWLLTRDGRDGAHTTDIAKKLEVRKSSVTEVLQSLARKGMLNYQQYAAVTLTEIGKVKAKEVTRRHEVLRTFLTDVLSINAAKADAEACRLEHAVSREVVERIIEFTEFISTCPRAGEDWIRGLSYQCREIDGEDRCRTCIQGCLNELDARQGGGEQRETITADQMKPGSRGKVVKLTAKGPVRKRMADMGVSRNATMEVRRVAPMGDPIEFLVKGYHLSLRKSEAAGIVVEVES